MDSWHEISRIPNAVPTRRDPMPTSLITARAFDFSQDLLWSGDNEGRVASYYSGPHGLMRYTSFKAQPHAIVDILTNPGGVITASKELVRIHNRRGIIKYTVKDEDEIIKGICCMAMSVKGTSEIVIAGEGDLIRINIDRGIIASHVPHTTGTITRMKRGGTLIAAGLENGMIELIDPNSLQVVKTFAGHQGPIIDLDFRGSTLVTCGYSARKTGYFPDPMVNVYDVRAMKPLAPMAFPAGAMFVRMHPKLTTCCMITGSSGQIQVLDYLRPTEVQIHHAAVASSVTGMDLSSTGDYMVLSDGDGFLQLWSNDTTGEAVFTEFAAPMDFPTVDDVPTSIDVEDETQPLSKVGMPYYKDELLSSWSDPKHKFSVGMPSGQIDSDVAKRLVKDSASGLKYAENVKKIPRNLVKPYVSFESARRSSVTVPKFKSEKERTGEVEDKSELFGETVKAGKVAKAYRKLEIKYSKFGINDFDFEFYNSTNYSGLETQLSNSYCNALLQLLRFSPIFYNFAVNSVAIYNNSKPSLLNEFGLLFDMMHKADGKACKAGNFLKTLKDLPDAKRYLYDDLTGPHNRKLVGESAMIQELGKYSLRQVTREAGSLFLEVGAIPVITTIKRNPCGVETQQEEAAFALDLVPPAPNSRKSAYGFLQVLRKSLERWTQGGAYCDHCGEYQHAGIMQTIRGFPQLLNITIPQDDYCKVMWEDDSSWPVQSFYVLNSRGKMTVRGDNKVGGTRYDLIGMVCEIGNHGERDNHLVTIAKTDSKDDKSWHLFNDFLVKKLDEAEAFDFSMKWKHPTLLLYQQYTGEEISFDYDSWKSKMDTSLLYRDFFIQGEMEGYAREYELLTNEEAPKPGTLVAMDAEFVKLQEEEIEINSDGSKSLVVPTMLSLARVSVVRGEGPKEGVTFIDDYISTTEPIVDYLTSFSGIEEGDLDPATSTKGLVTLQTSYKKLWLLLNLGCVFIGHGLHNDFRTINIQVPESQVIDTVAIYVRPRQRKLSLKFLAWYLLDEKVQTGNHDSIEDARTALFLYRKYQQLEREGNFERTLDIIYEEGRKFGYKPPHALVNGDLSRVGSSTNLEAAPSTPGTPY